MEGNYFLESLHIPDTISKHDTIVSTVQSGYEGLSIPSLPNTEAWMFAILFVLFLFLIFSVNRSFSWIVDAINNLSKVRVRPSIFSKTTAEEYQSRFLLVIFSTGVISLYVYTTLTSQTENFRLVVYMILFVVSLFFLFLKTVFMNLIGFIFLEHEQVKTAKENYFNTISFLGFLLYPVLIIKTYFFKSFNVEYFDFIAIILSITAFVFVTIKLFRVFFQKILDFFHIMLYLCTLEILPLLGMFQVYKWIIKEY